MKSTPLPIGLLLSGLFGAAAAASRETETIKHEVVVRLPKTCDINELAEEVRERVSAADVRAFVAQYQLDDKTLAGLHENNFQDMSAMVAKYANFFMKKFREPQWKELDFLIMLHAMETVYMMDRYSMYAGYLNALTAIEEERNKQAELDAQDDPVIRDMVEQLFGGEFPAGLDFEVISFGPGGVKRHRSHRNGAGKGQQLYEKILGSMPGDLRAYLEDGSCDNPECEIHGPKGLMTQLRALRDGK